MSTPEPSHAGPRHDSVHPSAPEDTYATWVGRVIDERYRIDSLLGEGGMGAVFEAQHLKLKKAVALKVIHPEFAGDGEVAKRFVREAMASAQLEHPHVAGAIDYGTLEEGGAYLVMQLVRGRSLRDELDDSGALGWVRACEIGAQIADALGAAHKAGIVHRDLKPDNVMLEPQDDGTSRVLVLDFGIARIADDKSLAGVAGQALTRVGTVIGTPGYMAPEQALGEPVDFRVDLYALGLLLFEMVAGRRLFEIDDLTAIVTRQLTEDVPTLSSLGFHVPQELEDLIGRMLTRDRTERPGSAAEVRETLKRLVLSAQLSRIASGEHSLPDVGAALAGDAMRPSPPSPREAATRNGRSPSGIAPTIMASTASSGAVRPAPSRIDLSALRTVPTPLLLAVGGVFAAAFLVVTVAVGLFAFAGDDEVGAKNPSRADGSTTTPEPPLGGEDDGRSILDVLVPDPPRPAPRAVPEGLAQANSDLMSSERARTRTAAARQILSYPDAESVPRFLTASAEIERERGCEARRLRVVELGELGDIRALPMLQRLEATPRNQCGNLFRRRDCLACLRDDLDVALRALRPE
ncbi:MAG: protein kinase [Sandaracinaceae bacterium]